VQAYLNLFDFKQKINYKNEILAGLTVAMTMMPESLSFAILAGFPPLVGLYAAFIMGLVTAVFGGRPGLISGGAGATVIVLSYCTDRPHAVARHRIRFCCCRPCRRFPDRHRII
jgi:sulfate permease, SulP family